MANGARDDLRRVSRKQNNQHPKVLSFIIYLIMTLIMVTLTFLNPFFMKNQIRTNNNEAIIVRQVNKHFDTLANEIGANKNGSANLLTIKQTQPIADHIIDYTLGTFFKFNNLNLANQILFDINLNIDQGTSSDAQLVQEKLKEQGSNASYEVVDAFSLNTVMVGSNVATALLLLNIIVLIMAAISLRSLIGDLRTEMTSKKLTHTIMGAVMWASFWLMLIAGIIALVPTVFNVREIAVFGYVLEISSSIFLDFVIVGVALYILSAILWEFTAPGN